MDLDQLRRIDLVEVMTALGLQPIERYSGTCEYRLADGRKLAVTPRPRNADVDVGLFQCWNGETVAGRRGGAGAIDLVMAVRGCTLRAALRFLSELRPGSTQSGASQRRADDPTPLFQRRSLPEAAPDALETVRRYLIAQRGLPRPLVDSLIAEKLIYAHVHSYSANETRRSFTNAVFVMRSDASEPVPAGSMLRGCYDGRKPRKSTLPFHDHPAAAFWIGTALAAAQAVVLTESPIEVLSYAALHPNARDSSNIRTYGGNRWRHVIRIFPQVSHLVIAFNADDEGKAAAAELRVSSGNGNSDLRIR